MASTNHVNIENVNAASKPFQGVWTWTRGMQRAGWKYMGSGNGVSKDTSKNPQNNLWNGTAGVVGPTVGVSGSGATIAAASLGRATVTGLSGITASHKGLFFNDTTNGRSYQIEEILSSTSVKIDARQISVTTGTVNWTLRNPAADTYPVALDAVSAWCCLQGPSILEFPLTSQPTGTFLRGENVTQAATGAEGEVLSYFWDPWASTGKLIVMPRVRGSGGGNRGWSSAQLSGEYSRATVTPSASPKEYILEEVFIKDTTTTAGAWFTGCFEVTADAGAKFSDIMASAGCTATVAPGVSGVGNTLPAHGAVTFAQSTSTTTASWHSPISAGNSQIICADAIEEEGYSADGSHAWTVFAKSGTVAGQAYSSHVIFGTQFVEDTVPGEVHPYVHLASRLDPINIIRTSVSLGSSGSINSRISSLECYSSWRGRGTSEESYGPAIPTHPNRGGGSAVALQNSGVEHFGFTPTGFGLQIGSVSTLLVPGYSRKVIQLLPFLVVVASKNEYIDNSNSGYVTPVLSIKGHPKWMKVAKAHVFQAISETPQSSYGYLAMGNAVHTYTSSLTENYQNSTHIAVGPWDMTKSAVGG